MADNTVLRATITADSKAVTDSLDKASKRFGGLTLGKAIKAASVIGIAATAVTAGAMIGLVKAYRSQEKSELKVRAVIAATGQAAGVTADAAFKMAKGLQSFTTFSDDLILDAQAVILTFKNIKGQVFERATALTLDLATELGKDLKSSAILFGKVLNDPVRNMSALSIAGVQFGKAQEKLIKELAKSGDLQGAQTVILDELESTYGGVAAQAALGTGGFEILANQITDLAQELGKVIAADLIPVIKGLSDLGPDLTESGFVQTTIEVFIANGAAFNAVINAILDSLGDIVLAAQLNAQSFNGNPLKKSNRTLRNVALQYGKDAAKRLANLGDISTQAYFKALRGIEENQKEYAEIQEKAAKISIHKKSVEGRERDAKEKLSNIDKLKSENTQLNKFLIDKQSNKIVLGREEIGNQILSAQIENQRLTLERAQFIAEEEAIFRLELNEEQRDVENSILKEKLKFSRSSADLRIIIAKQKSLEIEKIKNETRKKTIQNSAVVAAEVEVMNKNSNNFMGAITKSVQVMDAEIEQLTGEFRISTFEDIHQKIRRLLDQGFNIDYAQNKAFQIATIITETVVATAGIYAYVSDYVSLIIAIILALSVGAEAGLAISKINDNKYNRGGFALGSSGVRQGEVLNHPEQLDKFDGLIPMGAKATINRGFNMLEDGQHDKPDVLKRRRPMIKIMADASMMDYAQIRRVAA
jgi:hypothetical protein